MTRHPLCFVFWMQVVVTSCAWSEIPSWPSVDGPGIDGGTPGLGDAGSVERDGGTGVLVDAGGPVLPTTPAYPACTPRERDGSVMAIYSDVYDVESTISVFPSWNNDIVRSQEVVLGENMLRYTNFGFAAIDFGQTLDATQKTHLHVDVWTPNSNHLQIKLVDFGPNGEYDEATTVDDRESTVQKPIATEARWNSLDIELDRYLAQDSGGVGLISRAHLAQIIFSLDENENNVSSDEALFYVDNIYFYDDNSTATSEPELAPCEPKDAVDATWSIYSDAYTPIDEALTFSADWNDVGSAAELSIAVDENVLRYTELVFASLEFAPVNLQDATHLHLDVWSPQANEFKLKLVDFGANGTYDGNTSMDDVEHEIRLPFDFQGRWQSFEIPLADFDELTTRAALAQIILGASGAPQRPTIYLDNVYFFRHPQ